MVVYPHCLSLIQDNNDRSRKGINNSLKIGTYQGHGITASRWEKLLSAAKVRRPSRFIRTLTHVVSIIWVAIKHWMITFQTTSARARKTGNENPVDFRIHHELQIQVGISYGVQGDVTVHFRQWNTSTATFCVEQHHRQEQRQQC